MTLSSQGPGGQALARASALSGPDPLAEPVGLGCRLGAALTDLAVNPTSGVVRFMPLAQQTGSQVLWLGVTNAAGSMWLRR